MRYLSVCSGIEAASAAWESLGWKPVCFSEIELFPCELLAHRFGSNLPGEPLARNGVPNFGDMTKFREWPDVSIDLLVGGTPCQAFSIAGLRKGLDDPRGNLTLTYLALVERYRPEWFVWENVPGVFSSYTGPEPESDLDIGAGWEATETSDFGCFLAGIQAIGYGFAYRVLDAQYIRVDGHPRAVPQRRERVFVVGHSSGDPRRAAAVLFEPEGLRGDPAPCRKAGQSVAPTIASRPTGGGGLGTDFDLDGGLIAAEVAPAMNAQFGDKQGIDDQHINGGGDCSFPAVSLCLNAGGMGRIDGKSETLIPVNRCDFDEAAVAHALRADGFDASEDGTGRGTPLVPACYSIMPQNSGKDFKAREVDVAQPLMAGGPVGGNQGGDFILAPIAFPERMSGTQYGAMEGVSGALGAANPQAVAYAIQERAVSENPNAGPDGLGVQQGLAYTLEARQQVQGVAYDLRGREGGAQFEGPHETANIRAGDGGSSRSYVAHSWAVRRLTPLECERLQGFPDGWTAINRKNGKPAADGPRYKALGNSMAVNVMRWIGQRIEIARELP